MSGKLPLSQKTNSGSEEWNQDRAEIICQQKKLSSFSLLLPFCSSVSLLAIAAWLGVSASSLPALAQIRTREMVQTHQGQNPSQAQVIYVSSSAGSDSGDGSKSYPLRTIARALKFAEANTIILLAPGTYSAATGEIFPPNSQTPGNSTGQSFQQRRERNYQRRRQFHQSDFRSPKYRDSRRQRFQVNRGNGDKS